MLTCFEKPFCVERQKYRERFEIQVDIEYL